MCIMHSDEFVVRCPYEKCISYIILIMFYFAIFMFSANNSKHAT